MQIVQVKIGDLKPAEYNPRKLTKDQHQGLTESIKKFGLVDPIIVNEHPGRENVVVGGHQRLKIAQEQGFTEVPVVYINLDEVQEKELNLRLNKNLGEWDWDKLANNFDEDVLKEVGFSDGDLGMMPEEKIEPEVPFTEEMMEENNYVVLFFDNEVDWLNLQSLYPLPNVNALDSKPGFEKRGVGRVIRGVDFINKLRGPQ